MGISVDALGEEWQEEEGMLQIVRKGREEEMDNE